MIGVKRSVLQFLRSAEGESEEIAQGMMGWDEAKWFPVVFRFSILVMTTGQRTKRRIEDFTAGALL
jgi:hypothetical protein